jgi:hypothetical protein
MKILILMLLLWPVVVYSDMLKNNQGQEKQGESITTESFGGLLEPPVLPGGSAKPQKKEKKSPEPKKAKVKPVESKEKSPPRKQDVGKINSNEYLDILHSQDQQFEKIQGQQQQDHIDRIYGRFE